MSECPICLEEIKKRAVLECKHEMCSICIIKWLNQDHTCPICRATVNVRSPEFRVILNKLSMQELNTVIDNINRDNIGIVTQNQVYVRRPNVNNRQIRRRRNCDFICVNRTPQGTEENNEILRMIVALLIACILFLVILLYFR